MTRDSSWLNVRHYDLYSHRRSYKLYRRIHSYLSNEIPRFIHLRATKDLCKLSSILTLRPPRTADSVGTSWIPYSPTYLYECPPKSTISNRNAVMPSMIVVPTYNLHLKLRIWIRLHLTLNYFTLLYFTLLYSSRDGVAMCRYVLYSLGAKLGNRQISLCLR